ncbi:MAG: Fe-S-containing hydro-lyase [Oscillospiraceae bacterium]|nr:Fe-S-containing hydro-lyase [Oscillospiraceae bacterium]
MKTIKITTPFTDETIRALNVGDSLLLSGEIYTARDAAHGRMMALIQEGKPLPFDVHGQAVFYAGPCPAPPGRVIGSVGPTTSARMDAYAPRLIQQGLRVMIGKGERSEAVTSAIKAHGGVYLTAIGGTAALLSRCVTKCEAVAFEDLGAEAIYRLSVRDLPLVVAIDCRGKNIFQR